MDGWMDGWMDGEVLIIGKVVGWSGGIPKGLTSGPGAALVGESRSLFFSTHFREGLRSVFFDFLCIFEGFGKPKRMPKPIFQPFFFDAFLECVFASILGGFLEPRNLTNQQKPLFFSMVFVNFH